MTDKATQSMIENLQANTGKSLQQWVEIVTSQGFAKHGEMLSFLKEKHGLTHGFANLVALKARGADAGSAENTDDLLDAFERVWPPVSSTEHANNLESLVRLFRTLGRPQVASRFIQQWVDERKGDRLEELGSDQFHMFGPITDPELVEAMKQAFETKQAQFDLAGAIRKMDDDMGLNSEAIGVIAGAQPEDFVRALDENPGRYLSGAVTKTLKLSTYEQEPNWAIARENMRAALRLMARRGLSSPSTSSFSPAPGI